MRTSISQSGAKAVYMTREDDDKPEVYTPESILPISSKNALDAMLDWYAKPSIRQVCPDNVTARRWYIEKVRPTLRWFCKHLEEDTPRWLQDDFLPEWSDEERVKLFGDKPLHVVEFERRGPVASKDMKPQAKPGGKPSASPQ